MARAEANLAAAQHRAALTPDAGANDALAQAKQAYAAELEGLPAKSAATEEKEHA